MMQKKLRQKLLVKKSKFVGREKHPKHKYSFTVFESKNKK